MWGEKEEGVMLLACLSCDSYWIIGEALFLTTKIYRRVEFSDAKFTMVKFLLASDFVPTLVSV